MTSTTTPEAPTVAPLLRNLAVLDGLLGRGARAGLPLPTTCVRVDQYDVTLQWQELADLDAWADWLGVTVTSEPLPSGKSIHHQTTITDHDVKVDLICSRQVQS